MVRKIAALLGLFVVSNQAQATGLDLRLADETAEIIYLTESSTFGYGGADVGIGLLFNEEDDYMFSASAMITGHGAGNNRPLQFGAGVKLVFASLDNPDEEAGALAIGGQIRYVIPSSTPVAFLVEGFIAPEITSFSEADQYTEYRVAFELEVTPSTRAYIGYRNIEFDLDRLGDYEVDDEAHLGVRIEF